MLPKCIQRTIFCRSSWQLPNNRFFRLPKKKWVNTCVPYFPTTCGFFVRGHAFTLKRKAVVFWFLTLSLLMFHICGVSKPFGEWYQKTNKTEETNKLTLLAFKIINILHNTRRQSNNVWQLFCDRFLKRPLLTVSRSFMNLANRVLWRIMIIFKANKVNLFVSSVLFVFWYHSPNILDTPHIWSSL
jgi:hypothetical protein